MRPVLFLLAVSVFGGAVSSAAAAPQAQEGAIADVFNKAKELGDLKLDAGAQLTNATIGAGRFVVAWETKKPNLLGLGGGARLAIYSGEDRAKQLWASSFGKAFVGVGTSPADLEEFYYGFRVSQPGFSAQSTVQTVEKIAATSDGVVIRGALTFAASQVPYSVTLTASNGDATRLLGVQVDVDAAAAKALGVNRLVLEYASEKSEEFYGFGQQFPREFNRKGKRIPILVNEQGLGRGLEPLTFLGNTFSKNAGGDEFATYAPMPHYQSSKRHALFLENTEYSVFDLTKDDKTRIELASNAQLKAQLVGGATPLELIEGFTGFNGRQRKLPSWVSSGAIVGMQGGRAFVEEKFAKLQAVGAPVAAFWLQDWVGNRQAQWGTALWWNWEADEKRYPNWSEFVDSLRKQNVRMMTYVNPHASDIKELKTDPAPKRYLYEEVVANGFDVKNAQGTTQLKYQNATMFDLTNPKARDWVKQIIKENVLLNGKVSGYMCDFGEALELTAQLFDGDAAAYHNKYPEEWAKVNAEAVRELGLEDEVVFFMRAGFTRSPQHTPLFWLGDQLQSWDEHDGLKNVVFASTIGGFSGIALTHPDIGGYNYFNIADQGIPLVPLVYQRSKQLFLRSAEFAAFTAAFRTHDGSNAQKAWQFYSDDETLTLFARYANIFVAWGFYREQLMTEVVTKGYPLIRHMYLQYPDDAKVKNLHYQFMLGSQLLVAPQVDEDKTEVSVYLPQGKWVHVWSDKVFDGTATVKVATPIGEPAVFYPLGSSVGAQFVANLKAANVRK